MVPEFPIDNYGEYRANCSLQLRSVENKADAAQVSRFFLGEYCFDDQRFTPGEKEQLYSLPLRSLDEHHIQCWLMREDSGITAAVIFLENEHRSGGYRLEYLGVHREKRGLKLGHRLLHEMIKYCKYRNGRYIETFTCDLPEYEAARRLFEQNDFQFMCLLPEYYYPGEGKLLYLRPL